MRLPSEFIRLPFRFDVERLTQEVLAFDRSEWMPHVQGFAGNSAIPLISLNGEMNDDFKGPMQITEKLRRSPYISQVIASFGEVFSRSRLMGLEGKCAVQQHWDANYHWYTRVRIHIPVITNPDVLFYCGDTHLHMAAGETWLFDSWKMHKVENASDQFRVHLVIDTAGSARFWELVGASEWRGAGQRHKPASVADRLIPYEEGGHDTILTEKYNSPLVMHPGEMDALIMDILYDLRACDANPVQAARQMQKTLQDFRLEWRRLWSLYGESREGWQHFDTLIRGVRLPEEKLLLASNGGSATYTFQARVLAAALSVPLARQYESA